MHVNNPTHNITQDAPPAAESSDGAELHTAQFEVPAVNMVQAYSGGQRPVTGNTQPEATKEKAQGPTSFSFVTFDWSEVSTCCGSDETDWDHVPALDDMILLQAKIPSGHALIDTGAQNAVIGQQDYNELKLRLAQQGLKPRELPGQGQCKGVGGVSKYVLTAEVPVSVAGIHGLLTTNVVGAPVPYLLPINFLKACGMVLDLEEMTCTWKAFGGLQSDISELVSGHLAVDMLDNISGWKNPHEQKGNVVLNESPLHQKFGKPKQSDFDIFLAV